MAYHRLAFLRGRQYARGPADLTSTIDALLAEADRIILETAHAVNRTYENELARRMIPRAEALERWPWDCTHDLPWRS